MLELYLNPLSANNQCPTPAHCDPLVEEMVSCFEYCFPSISSKRLTLLYDPRIESRKLHAGTDLNKTVNNFPRSRGAKDICKLWYLYTRNHSKPVSAGEGRTVLISDPKALVLGTIGGNVHRSAVNQYIHWLSFRGVPIFDLKRVLAAVDGKKTSVSNINSLSELKKILPLFEPNKKHHKFEYLSATGEKVSAMPIRDVEAQQLLFSSLGAGKSRWAHCTRTGRYFCFKKTYPNREVFHGFVVDRNIVPASTAQKLSE